MTHIPYGYRVENGKAFIYEPEAEKIRSLYRNYLECKSMMKAAKTVGIKKAHPSIGRILNNAVYLGTDFYPRLVDEDIFHKVQEIRKENAVQQNRLRPSKPLEEARPKTHYRLGKVETQYDNPYSQAEYAYSQIEEVKS